MPHYDLHCADCGTNSNISASIADKVEKKIACPDCGSRNLETIYGAVSVHVKSNAPSCPNSHICGAGCRHGH